MPISRRADWSRPDRPAVLQRFPLVFVFEGYLEQLTTIKVDNVVAGETIDIHLPNTTSLTSAVPEPGSLALLGIGLLFKCGVAWQRKRGSRTS